MANRNIEVVYQIRNTECKTILVEPPLLQTLLEAASKTQFPTDRIFLFSDKPNEPLEGIRDWRSFLISASAAESWKWDQMSADQSRSNVAALNYSSGTVGQVLGDDSLLTPLRQAYQKA